MGLTFDGAGYIYPNCPLIMREHFTSAQRLFRNLTPPWRSPCRFFAVQFSKNVLCQLRYYKFHSLIARLRKPSPPIDWRAELVPHIKLALAGDSLSTPFAFEHWIRLLARAELDPELSFTDGA